jgi:hypothetical protein
MDDYNEAGSAQHFSSDALAVATVTLSNDALPSKDFSPLHQPVESRQDWRSYFSNEMAERSTAET